MSLKFLFYLINSEIFSLGWNQRMIPWKLTETIDRLSKYLQINGLSINLLMY